MTAHLPNNERTLAVLERPDDPDTTLYRLRAAFPHYAFLYDPHAGTWTALRGPAIGGFTKVTRDPAALRIAVAEAKSRRSL